MIQRIKLNNRNDEATVDESFVYHSKELAGVNEQYHLFLRDKVIPLQGGDSALELGVGKGLWTQILSQRYKKLDIVDLHSDLLDIALVNCKSNLCQITTHEGMIEEFIVKAQLNHDRWQHVYMTFLLEHLKNPIETLKQVSKLIQKNGLLFIAVPNAESIHRVIALRGGIISNTEELSQNDKKVGHLRVYNKKLLREHVLSGGYQIISEDYYGFKPLNLKQMEEFEPQIIEAFCRSGDLAPDYSAYISIIAQPKKV